MNQIDEKIRQRNVLAEEVQRLTNELNKLNEEVSHYESLPNEAARGSLLVKINNHTKRDLRPRELEDLITQTLVLIKNGDLASVMNQQEKISLWYSKQLKSSKVVIKRRGMAPNEGDYIEIANISFSDNLYANSHLRTQDVLDIINYLKEMLNQQKGDETFE